MLPCLLHCQNSNTTLHYHLSYEHASFILWIPCVLYNYFNFFLFWSDSCHPIASWHIVNIDLRQRYMQDSERKCYFVIIYSFFHRYIPSILPEYFLYIFTQTQQTFLWATQRKNLLKLCWKQLTVTSWYFMGTNTVTILIEVLDIKPRVARCTFFYYMSLVDPNHLNNSYLKVDICTML